MESHRSKEQSANSYEIMLGGRKRADDWEQDRTLIKALSEAGITWWVEYVPAGELEAMRESVKRGPLHVEQIPVFTLKQRLLIHNQIRIVYRGLFEARSKTDFGSGTCYGQQASRDVDAIFIQ